MDLDNDFQTIKEISCNSGRMADADDNYDSCLNNKTKLVPNRHIPLALMLNSTQFRRCDNKWVYPRAKGLIPRVRQSYKITILINLYLTTLK